ncbi:23S rRNA (uracil(1939)-C(5))-methyltransferase RlmD [Anaerobutyricum hallii]|uniref:23S rRNA (uracil(1939)-C(5))-methyltransferase RlmD n=2 Tax=Anaerobutyricum hallii TaxID=39488 RepID=UPI00399CB155
MKKGDIFEGKVIRTEFPNKGIIDIEGQKVIVKNALEGQVVRFSINKKRRDKVEGRLLEVIEPSPLEQPAACKHFGICGGCRYQNLSYEQQLDLKKRQVEELIEKNGLSFDIENIYGSPITEGYRNKMEFTFGDEEKDGPLALGMHKKNSFYDIVTLDDCRIVDPDFNVLLQAILKYFKEKGETYFHKIRHEGFLRHLVMRRSVKTGDILINLVTTTQSQLDESEFVNMILAQKIDGKVVGILHTLNDNLADVVQSDETKTLYGQDYFYEYLYNMRFKISPFSFFQTNTLGAEVLYDQVREYVGETKDKLVYDLYTGTGTIAQMLAPVASKVVGVEIVEEAVEAAKKNAVDNHLDNCEFIAGDVLKVVDNLTQKPDILVLDPPRDGIHPKALRKIINFNVDEMVYVSCKPTSLMRDLLVFREAGYEVKRACLVDMFPGTVHVETVVLLSKGEVDSKKIRVEFSLEDMDMSEFQDGATYTQIKDYVLEHSGLKVSNLYISQIKRKCGIEVGKNYNLPKSEDSRQPQCPPEKEKAIREAMKYFGMI